MMRRPLALLLSFALALPVQAYDLPDLGDVASSELSPAAERRIGEQIISQIPVGRIGEPSDIARAVDFLAADAAGFLTGVNLPVNGGLFISF